MKYIEIGTMVNHRCGEIMGDSGFVFVFLYCDHVLSILL